jgi:CheY-like chemotaxis protein
MAFPAPKERPVILVVEDEPLIRMVAVDMVEDAGFEAVECSNATDAVAILEQRTDIRIVFTDIDMPNGINGMLLAAAIRDRWPPIHLIVTSGHYLERNVTLPPGTLFFAKPYQLEDVAAAMVKFLVEA